METVRASVGPVASLTSVAPTGSRATVIDITPYLRGAAACVMIPGAESTLDPLWGDLLNQAFEAWTWRDPDSLSALESVVTKLKAMVLVEWQ